VVSSEKREEPDWDRYISALVALAMRQVKEDDKQS
jgi:hypothetical protein